jgi:hypothetical protein
VSISRRTAVAVRSLGVASAAAVLSLGFAGSAFACQIADFHASVACDSTNGTATITVTDNDANGPSASVSLFNGSTQIGTTQTVSGGTQGSPGQVSFTDVPWMSTGEWTVHVTVPHYIDDQTVEVDATGAACSAPTTPVPPTTPPATPSTTPSKSTSASPSTSASVSASASASASPSSSVDSSVTASPSGPALAETGGGNDSGLIAGVAGALVIAGGGVVFALRRRSVGRH